jgi:hypothetical protein
LPSRTRDGSGCGLTTQRKHIIPFKETLADEMNVSLIALGSHGRGAVQEMLAGSTFENVARLSRQPVLVVRHRPGERA